MKQVTDLKIQRANYISEMETLVNSAKEGQRDLSEVENTRWSQLNADIKKIDNSIEMLERQDELNKSIVTVTAPKIVAPRNYSIGKAVKGLASGRLEGLEFERHNELTKNTSWDGRGILIPFEAFEKRAVLAHADNTSWEPTFVNDNLSIIKTKNYLQELGVTFMPNLTGNLRLPSMNSVSAAFVNEKSDMSEFTVTQGVELLSARRIAGYKDVSAEFFAENSASIIDAMVIELVDSIYRTITADIFDNIDSQITVVSGMGSGETATAISASILTAMEASLNTDGLGDLKYVTSPAVRGQAKATAFLANQAPIWLNNQMNGYNSYATSLVNTYSGATKHQLVLADFSKVVVGIWGANSVQVLLDPYTNGLKNYTRVIVSMLADTGIWNKDAFALAQHIKPTA